MASSSLNTDMFGKEMNKYAIIEDGKVANVAVCDGEWPFPDQTAILVPDGKTAVIGGSQYPDDWITPETSASDARLIPAVVSRFQLRAAFYEAGHMPAIEKIMAAKTTAMLTKLAWADEQVFRRDANVVAALASALELSEHQVDELFISAAAIVA